MNNDTTNPKTGLRNRSRNKSGIVMAPQRREICASRLPKMPNPVIGTTM